MNPIFSNSFRILSAALLCLVVGCNREVVERCYTCTSFVSYSYSGTPISRVSPSPYSIDSQVCDEQEKITAAKGKTETAFTIGGTSLIKTYQTVCVKRAKR